MNQTFFLKLHFGKLLLLVYLTFGTLESRGANFRHSNTIAEEDSIVATLYSIPSPDEIFNYINAGNLRYNPQILSDPKKINKYKNSREQFLAVGIFLADLSYTLAFQQPAKGFEYMKVIDEVGNNQNLFPYLDYEFKERFLTNMSNIDSLIVLSDYAYDLAMENLFENQRFDAYSLVSFGCILESMFLTLSSLNKENPSAELMKRVADQSNLIDQLVEMIKLYMSQREARILLKDLNPLVASFDSFNVEKNETKVKTRYDRVFIQPTKEISVTKEKLDNLRIAVNELRVKWVK